MSVFFKIADNGCYVYVAKTLISNEMKEEEFNNKAIRLTADQFLSKFPKIISENLEQRINRVKEICDMKLSIIRKDIYSNASTRTTRSIYTIGDKKFAQDCGEEEKLHEFEKALEYGKQFYGEDVMEECLRKFKSNINEIYLSGKKEISKEKYIDLIKEKNVLTNIVCLQKKKIKQFNCN